MKFKVLYEDKDILAVNKSPGLSVQPDTTGSGSLFQALSEETGYLGLVHRIDKPASGIVLMAKNKQALADLNAQIQNKLMEKIYWAVVCRPPPYKEGICIHYLEKNGRKNKSYAYEEMKKGRKKAELHYRVAGLSEKYTFLEILLITGRHHQARCQLSAIGCPVKGDIKYGAPRTNHGGGIHLHSRTIRFSHPRTEKSVEILAEPPADVLWDLFLKCNV